MPTAVDLPPRLLLGSGPSIVPARILEALARPTIGHLDPAFGALQDDLAAMLRATMNTDNRVTFPLSATGSGGMQAMVDTLIAPGDRVVCGVHGAFGARMADALGRAGADVVRVEAAWGRAIPTELLVAAAAGGDTRALFVVHGETSTGVCQPLDGLAEAVAQTDGLLLVDCVTSLAGQPLDLDAAGVDAAFSGTQKCLNVPPGLAPFTVGERALGRLQRRSWYFDLQAMVDYWFADGPRAYHHTAPINLIYALHEGLRAVLEEGLEARWARHARAHEALRGALSVFGFERLAPDGEQLHPLLAVRVPDGIDEAAVRGALLIEDGIEVSGGLGPLAGTAWRIGVMGEGAHPEPQERLVRAVARRVGGDEASAVGMLEDGWARTALGPSSSLGERRPGGGA
jgi:alanine-glyoxylate transaminase/serine-glyoxylate transaminase/serine-pyruvate transaminase